MSEEQAKTLTREELEKNMEKHNAEDIAAAFFTLEQPNLKRLLDDLSQRQMRRLIFQLVSYPFTPKEYKPTDELEKKAFYLGNEMIQNRMIMQLSLEMQKVQEAEQKQNEQNAQGEQNVGSTTTEPIVEQQ